MVEQVVLQTLGIADRRTPSEASEAVRDLGIAHLAEAVILAEAGMAEVAAVAAAVPTTRVLIKRIPPERIQAMVT
jgi:hypothetical protein